MKPRSVARLSRVLGIPLTPKSTRYFERRPYPPGVHGRRRRNPSAYRLQLLEKQRLRGQYDLRERQFRRIINEAIRRPGKTGEVLIELLERRLDAVVLRSGFARTIYQARQMVTHGHITVDGQKVDRPSYRLQRGQIVGDTPVEPGQDAIRRGRGRCTRTERPDTTLPGRRSPGAAGNPAEQSAPAGHSSGMR